VRLASGELRVTLQHALAVCALFATGVSSPVQGLAQTDPYWLRSWDEAQTLRPAIMTSSGRIAPEDEPGTPLVIRGQVVEPDGRTPAEGIVVHSYHRDLNGFDFGPNDSALTTWRLQGWATTDVEGRFEFRTIRPAGDHLGREGAHVHFTLESRDFSRQWAPTVFLSDDPLVTENQRRRSAEAGEFRWVREVETVDGVQHVAVRIQLKGNAEF